MTPGTAPAFFIPVRLTVNHCFPILKTDYYQSVYNIRKGFVFFREFFLHDIQRRTGKMPALKRPEKRFLIHEASPGTVLKKPESENFISGSGAFLF